MKIAKGARPFSAIVFVAAVLAVASCSGTSVGVGLGYQPLVIPVRFSATFSVSPDGGISVSGGAGIVTDVGIFSAEVNYDNNARPASTETLLVIRHRQRATLVDSVYRIATGEEIVISVNGRTLIYVSNRKIFVNASDARMTHLVVRNAPGLAGRAGSAVASGSKAPPPVSGDTPPVTDPGQLSLPAGATILGRVNLEEYCQQNWRMHAVLRFPNTWGWRCSPSLVQASGERRGDQDVSVTEACIEKYGTNSISHYSQYSDPNSWLCYQT
jgi:hypothetical protein